ncbi:unnamed protein product [Arctogadus glacialis]
MLVIQASAKRISSSKWKLSGVSRPRLVPALTRSEAPGRPAAHCSPPRVGPGAPGQTCLVPDTLEPERLGSWKVPKRPEDVRRQESSGRTQGGLRADSGRTQGGLRADSGRTQGGLRADSGRTQGGLRADSGRTQGGLRADLRPRVAVALISVRTGLTWLGQDLRGLAES